MNKFKYKNTRKFYIPMSDIQIPQPNMSDGGAAPSFMYSFIIFREWSAWSERVSQSNSDEGIDKATAVLLAICPNNEKREDLWEKYTKEKESGKEAISAATVAAGGLMSYLAEILEFTSSSYGAF
jgi:hypothetical protein